MGIRNAFRAVRRLWLSSGMGGTAVRGVFGRSSAHRTELLHHLRDARQTNARRPQPAPTPAWRTGLEASVACRCSMVMGGPQEASRRLDVASARSVDGRSLVGDYPAERVPTRVPTDDNRCSIYRKA